MEPQEHVLSLDDHERLHGASELTDLLPDLLQEYSILLLSREPINKRIQTIHTQTLL